MRILFMIALFFSVYGASEIHAQNKATDTATETKDTMALAASVSDDTRPKKNNEVRKTKLSKGELVDSLQTLNDSIAKLHTAISRSQQQLSEERFKQAEAIADKLDSLGQEIRNRDKIINDQIVGTFGLHLKDAPRVFCRLVMESPLLRNYNDSRVQMSLDIAKAMGYDNKNSKYNSTYEIYKVLLEKYHIYNRELIENIDLVMEDISLGSTDRVFELQKFEDRLKNSRYYEVRGTGKDGDYRHISYLDLQIENLRKLFKDDASFTKKNFDKIRKYLRGE